MTVIENTIDKQKEEENDFPQFHRAVTAVMFLVLVYVSRCEIYKHIGVGKVSEKLSNCVTLCKLFLACFLFQSIPSISFHCLHLIILSVGHIPSPDCTIIYFSNLLLLNV